VRGKERKVEGRGGGWRREEYERKGRRRMEVGDEWQSDTL
jgi:hypothetical protein